MTPQPQIFNQALLLAPFEGWTMSMLEHAAENAGLDKIQARNAFPRGIADCLDYFNEEMDRRMLGSLEIYHLETMKIRERIAVAVRIRLELFLPHRESIRRLVALQAIRPLQSLSALYRTVDAIWRAVGDTSTDFNFYTKRLLLAKVYASTLLFWLDDKTPGQTATEAFLQRRIEDVMKIEKFKGKVKEAFGLS